KAQLIEPLQDGIPRPSTDKAGHLDGQTEALQHLGHVDSLASGKCVHLIHPMNAPRTQGRHSIGFVDGRIKGYDGNHGTTPLTISILRFATRLTASFADRKIRRGSASSG